MRFLERSYANKATVDRDALECGRRDPEMMGRDTGLCGLSRWSATQRDLLKIVESLLEGFLVGITGGHSNPNATDRHVDLGADFQ